MKNEVGKEERKKERSVVKRDCVQVVIESTELEFFISWRFKYIIIFIENYMQSNIFQTNYDFF
jgi:hypothetical protein